MTTLSDLSDLLDRYARPREDDPVLETILRAEMGIRLVGATVAAAVATLPPPPGPSSRILKWLKRPRTGDWAQATRLGLYLLEAAKHPLAPWADLCEARLSDGRAIDRWLTEYETALRHGGRNPPRDAEPGLRKVLVAQIGDLCDRIASSLATSSRLSGEGERTAIGDVPTAPFLMVHNGDLWFWDGACGSQGGNRGSRWIRGVDRGTEEHRDRDWRCGAAALLIRAAGSDPFAAFLGDRDEADGDAFARPTLFTVPVGDPIEAAEALAARLRTARRPVIVVPLLDVDRPVSRLHVLLSDDPRVPEEKSIERLRDWRGDLPLVLFAGGGVDAPTALAVEEVLRGVATPGIVTAAHVLERWPPEARRRFVHSPVVDPPSGLPQAVVAQLEAGSDPVLAWAYAAADYFEIQDRDSAQRLLHVATGLADPLGDPVVSRWWGRGDLLVGVDARPILADAGWSALLRGLHGETHGAEDAEAWNAGVWLRRRFLEVSG